jgi:hypothetical protein
MKLTSFESTAITFVILRDFAGIFSWSTKQRHFKSRSKRILHVTGENKFRSILALHTSLVRLASVMVMSRLCSIFLTFWYESPAAGVSRIGIKAANSSVTLNFKLIRPPKTENYVVLLKFPYCHRKLMKIEAFTILRFCSVLSGRSSIVFPTVNRSRLILAGPTLWERGRGRGPGVSTKHK